MKRGYIKNNKTEKIRREIKPQMLFKSYSLRMIEQISISIDRVENKDLPNSLILGNQ